MKQNYSPTAVQVAEWLHPKTPLKTGMWASLFTGKGVGHKLTRGNKMQAQPPTPKNGSGPMPNLPISCDKSMQLKVPQNFRNKLTSVQHINGEEAGANWVQAQ